MSRSVVLAEAPVFPVELVIALLIVVVAATVVAAVIAWVLGVGTGRGSVAARAVSAVAAVGWVWVVASAGPSNLLSWSGPAIWAAGVAWGRYRSGPLRSTSPAPPPPPSAPVRPTGPPPRPGPPAP